MQASVLANIHRKKYAKSIPISRFLPKQEKQTDVDKMAQMLLAHHTQFDFVKVE